MIFRLGTRDLTTDDYRRYLLAYNAGDYAPARASNVEADYRAYRLFDGGLARDRPAAVRLPRRRTACAPSWTTTSASTASAREPSCGSTA
ncbi:MAG: hypothetical protein ACE37K_20215 [Planctomycetota bacterium]